jgi:transposase
VIEASTDSEWVARCLEALGHEVIVADPNFAPMYATRTRKVARIGPSRSRRSVHRDHQDRWIAITRIGGS